MSLTRMAAAEAVGTALLLAIVVGSGIMGERLAQGNVAIALLANSIATGTGLYALIVVFGPVSGAHFNPVVSGVSMWEGRLSARHALYMFQPRLAEHLWVSLQLTLCLACQPFRFPRIIDPH